MNILLLGGNGYLGSKIANKFSDSNKFFCTVRKNESLNLLVNNDNIEIIDSNIESIKRVIDENKIDTIINTVCCYEKNFYQLQNVVEANLVFPLNVITYAIGVGIKRIITIDTSLPEDVNLYSLTKKSVARILKYFSKYYSVSIFDVVLENFYGEDEPKNRFLHETIKKLKRGDDVLLTSGIQKRDFIYIDDVLQAISILLKDNSTGYIEVPVGTGEGPTIKEVVEYLKFLTNSTSTLKFGIIKERDNEPDCVANISYLKSRGFQLKYPYKIGLKRLL